MLILAWARTYSIPYIIVRPTNNYGIGQYVEKFIPKAIKNLSLGKKIVMHNEGLPKRTWLHVSDTANAVITIIEKNVVNEIYNISGNVEKQNIDVAQQLLGLFYSNTSYTFNDNFDFSEVRPGQDVRYSINDKKLKDLGWEPKAIFENELIQIMNWYRKNFIW